MNIRLERFLLRRSKLVEIKRRALRRGVWFKVLSHMERVQIDLTIRVVDKVRSSFLAKVLHPLLRKLLDAMESNVWRLVKTVGADLAHKISEAGKKLGCKRVEEWVKDLNFIRFLTVMHMNTPGLYKT